ELRATRAGQIAQVLAKANENVGGGTPIVVLTPEQALQVTIAVPAAWVERLTGGMPARVRLPEVDLELPATLTEVGGTSRTAGAFPVTVQLPEEDPRVRPGMVAEVVLDLPATGESRIELPLSAIGEDEAGRFVWVVTEGEPPTVSRTSIETGELTADGLVVTGIEPGAVVVTAGLSKLYEGRAVRVDAR
ncbi:MAG: RND family efflux transporter MFP subunit, partial [Myxococcota bacterium]